MDTIERRWMRATPEAVFAELADAWMFPAWVVGASHIRAVDPHWPEEGAALHHRVGPWPLSISDTTRIVIAEPPHRLLLRARAWPLGEAAVELTVTADGAGSLVMMREWPTRGPGRWLNNRVLRFALQRRNRESLARLATIAESRRIPAKPAG